MYLKRSRERLNAVGIIAEYNPLHRGHAYHIRKSRGRGGFNAVISVISSNFVQRGLPAVADKSVRAAMAIESGVDLVLELPVVFSSHNAGVFANAAVDILASTGLVSGVSFGMETPDLPALSALADLLNEEPRSFKTSLKKFLREGYSFVQSRSMALDESVPGALDLLKSPNNNLALAYVKRVREKNYNIEPFAVERIGAGFHEEELPSVTGNDIGAHIASAAAIRSLLCAGKQDERDKQKLAYSMMPDACAALLREAWDGGRLALGGGRLWRAVRQALLRAGAEGLREISEMGEGLENRMIAAAWRSESFESFVESCVTRRYTKGRIQRHCAHLLIGLSHEESRAFQRSGPAYIRVLGANETGRSLLALMRDTASLPVISRAHVPKGRPDVLSVSGAAKMMEIEHRAAELWEMLTDRPEIRAEARRVPLMAGKRR
ncbi:MAG: nucleotidyltransferase family protein [Synergistaceae bacterium]|jgi:predicted nucleotidyltransferase|nr:nucleotidyltransferase family protein [Synergistaceae bacterium]